MSAPDASANGHLGEQPRGLQAPDLSPAEVSPCHNAALVDGDSGRRYCLACGTTEAAANAAKGYLVPSSRGGMQVEWHQNGWDVEVEFDRDGVIQNVNVGRA